MGVDGEELDPDEAPGGKVTDESRPVGPVLRRVRLQTKDVTVPADVHARGHQGVSVHGPAALVESLKAFHSSRELI